MLLVPVALLPDLAAALPLRTYFFRDFTATFYPSRLFAARELREGRFPVWNPFIFEGSFQVPALYLPDLLHVLWLSPVWFSWLLTLHLPLAALGAWWLAREVGASREGALLAGALYALGGLALSTLNLYVFLQALALAPLVAGLLRRAGLDGGRRVVEAGVGLALALSTLTVEFVGQAVLLGTVLGLLQGNVRASGRRLIVAMALGIGLAGLPLAMTLGLLPETIRGTGFAAEVSLGNAVHPAVLLQTVLPNLFGVPQAPAEAWWGGRFFSKGFALLPEPVHGARRAGGGCRWLWRDGPQAARGLAGSRGRGAVVRPGRSGRPRHPGGASSPGGCVPLSEQGPALALPVGDPRRRLRRRCAAARRPRVGASGGRRRSRCRGGGCGGCGRGHGDARLHGVDRRRPRLLAPSRGGGFS